MHSNRISLYLIVLFVASYCVGQDCAEANIRAAHAFQRAQRAAARSQIAVLRIHAELRAASITGYDGPIATYLSNKPSGRTSHGRVVETQALGVQDLRDQARTLASAAMEVMKQFYPQRYNRVVSIPNYRDEDRTTSGVDDCEAAAAESEVIAFAAEQWSQLADIAAEQAIELSARRIAAGVDPGPKR